MRELIFALKESDGLHELDEALTAQASEPRQISVPEIPPPKAFLEVLPGGLKRQPKPDDDGDDE